MCYCIFIIIGIGGGGSSYSDGEYNIQTCPVFMGAGTIHMNFASKLNVPWLW